MSKSSRRRLCFASLRNVAFASLLTAALVGSGGCSGGSNPFCCDSKEKSQVDNLERAQSLDEHEKNSTPTEENSDETQEETKKTIHANILRSDGSGDAPVVAATTPKAFAQEEQEVPNTASTSADARKTLAPTADSTGLLQAPSLPTQVQTPPDAQAVPTSESAPAVESVPTNESASAVENATQGTNETPDATAPNADEKPSSESQETQNTENAQDDAAKQETQESPEAQQDKEPETPVNAARSSRRNGAPQRAATRQVAQRAAAPTVAVPQTRAAATFSAPAPVVYRTRVVVP